MMMETKHTPGPWEILPNEPDKDYIRIRGTQLGAQYKIANVVSPTYNDTEETMANARLIAAAPDLLAAMIEYLAAADNSMNPPDGDDVAAMLRFGEADKAVRAAIAKATGA